MDKEISYVPASPEARSLVVELLTHLIGDGGRSDEDDNLLREVVNELQCLNMDDQMPGIIRE